MAASTVDRRIRRKGGANVTEAVQDLAKETYKAKVAKNEASRAETKARKTLFKAMKDAGVKQFTTVAVVGSKRVTLEAEIAQPERVVVDVNTLRKLVSEEDFLKIVSATQTNVVKHVGEATLRRCSDTTPGTENVSVNPAD